MGVWRATTGIWGSGCAALGLAAAAFPVDGVAFATGGAAFGAGGVGFAATSFFVCGAALGTEAAFQGSLRVPAKLEISASLESHTSAAHPARCL